MTRAILITTVILKNPVTVFVDRWVLPCRIPANLLTGKGLKFLSKFFAAVHVRLGVKHLTNTAYRPLTNGQVEHSNKTIVASL